MFDYRLASAIAALTWATLAPRSKTTLLRDSSPEISATFVRARENKSARNAMSAWLARPSSGWRVHRDLQLRRRPSP